MDKTWSSQSTDDNGVMSRLRAMLDTLEEEMVADRPEEEYMLEGIVVGETQEEDEESLSEAAEGDSSKKVVDHSDKKEENS